MLPYLLMNAWKGKSSSKTSSPAAAAAALTSSTSTAGNRGALTVPAAAAGGGGGYDDSYPDNDYINDDQQLKVSWATHMSADVMAVILKHLLPPLTSIPSSSSATTLSPMSSPSQSPFFLPSPGSPTSSSSSAQQQSHNNQQQSRLGITTAMELLLVSKTWSEVVAACVYARPVFTSARSFELFARLLTMQETTYHDYPALVNSLVLEDPAADSLEIGDLETTLALASNLQHFALVSSPHVSSLLLQFLAESCPQLLSVSLTGCPIGDGKIPILVKGCPKLKRVDLGRTNVTLKSLDVLVKGLVWLEELFMDGAGEDFSFPSSGEPSPIPTTPYLNKVSLSSTPVTPKHLRLLALRAPHITHLTLSYCSELTDDGVAACARGFPNLSYLDCDFCDRLTDVSLQGLAVHLSGRSQQKVYPDNNTSPSSTIYYPAASPSSSSLQLSSPSSPTSPISPSGEGERRNSSVGGMVTKKWVSPLKTVRMSGTRVTVSGVRWLVTECGSLEEVRLDACERVIGVAGGGEATDAVVENVALECWREMLALHEQRMGGGARRKSSGTSPKSGGGVGLKRTGSVSKLPVPVRRPSVLQMTKMEDRPATSPTSPPATPAQASSSLGGPPPGWCRLLGRAAMRKVSLSSSLS